MTDSERSCPQCQSRDLVADHLSVKASAWPVMFGGELFHKNELVAYACKECGYVFLYLSPGATSDD